MVAVHVVGLASSDLVDLAYNLVVVGSHLDASDLADDSNRSGYLLVPCRPGYPETNIGNTFQTNCFEGLAEWLKCVDYCQNC